MKATKKPTARPIGSMEPTKCDRCGTVWHSSQRRPGDRCGDGKRGCKGVCR